VAVTVFTVLGMALVGWFAVHGDTPSDVRGVSSVGFFVSIAAYGLTGAVLIDRRPDLPFGWLLAGAATLQILSAAVVFPAVVAVESGNDSGLVRWGLACSGLIFAPAAVQGLVNVRFPSGKPATRVGRMLEFGIAAGTAVSILAALLGASNLRDIAPDAAAGLEHPLTGGTSIGGIFDALAQVLPPLVVLLGLLAGIGVVIRYRRAVGIERQQLKWRAAGVLAALALFPFAVAELIEVSPIDNLLFALTLVIPVLRYRLWAIDTILRRSAIYAIVTVVVISSYVGLTVAATSVVSERIGASIAAAAVAIGFAPLLHHTRRLVDRVAWGNRSDPYRTISELDRRLASIVRPGQMLPTLIETIADSLRLPYVAIERPDGTVLSAHGVPDARAERWPLTYDGAEQGALVATPRRGEDEFDERDRRLLGDVARHAGVAVHAETLTADLQVSRQRLVNAREEERRRLRRDLHDGLGPTLTAVGLNIDAARAQLRRDPDAADCNLQHAKQATAQAISDVRRVVYGLRPPALDNHGLIGALGLHLDRIASSHRCGVHLRSDDLPALPAAVEVAAFRTVIEAVTNAIRHGQATQCWISVSSDGEQLVVDVTDDGRSEGDWTPGVGLLSLREQAVELGGALTAGPRQQGGYVGARFPISGVPG
jgi:signal transduction histidine kinase